MTWADLFVLIWLFYKILALRRTNLQNVIYENWLSEGFKRNLQEIAFRVV